jgi:hypothetical protein
MYFGFPRTAPSPRCALTRGCHPVVSFEAKHSLSSNRVSRFGWGLLSCFALVSLLCLLSPIAGHAQGNCTPPALGGNEAAWRAAYISWCRSNGGEVGNYSDSSGSYSGWGCHPGSQWKCGAGSSGSANSAASTGSPVGDALNMGANLWIIQNVKNPYTAVFAQNFTQGFLTSLFASNTPEAQHQRQLANEAIRQRQLAEAERARKAEQDRLDAIFARLNGQLKLTGFSDELALKTSGSSGNLALKLGSSSPDAGLHMKLGEDATPGYGIAGLPGVYVGGPRSDAPAPADGGSLKLKLGDVPSTTPASMKPATNAGISGLPGIYLNAEPAQAAQLADSATNLSGTERNMAEDAALQAAAKNPALAAPSDDVFVQDYQAEAKEYDAALKARQDALEKASEAQGHVQADKSAIDYVRSQFDPATAPPQQQEAFQKLLQAANTDEDAAAAGRAIFDNADVRLTILRDRATDALATLAPPVNMASSPNRVSPSAPTAPLPSPSVSAKIGPVANAPVVNLTRVKQPATPNLLATLPMGGEPTASPLAMCIADGARKIAAGESPLPSDEELHRQLDQALEAYRRVVETQEHELEDRADWIKDLNKATLDMSLGFFDKGLGGLLGPEGETLHDWQSGMRHEVMSNRNQIVELSALADAEKDAVKSAALRQQIFDLSMRNQLLHTGLNAIRNAKTIYQGYDMAAPARDAGLWLTDSGDSLGNSGSLGNKIAPLEHAKRLDVSNIIPKDQTGVAAMLGAVGNSGGLEDSMDGVKQLLKITMKQPGVKAWLKASSETLGMGTGITEWYEGLSLTIDTAYDLSVGYAGYARLKQIKSNVAQLERAKSVLAERIRRVNAELACYSKE